MKISLIEPKAPGIHVYSKFKLPRLGLPIIGALLERELKIKTKVFVEELGAIDWAEVLSSDLIGLSSITATSPRAYYLIEKIKKKGPIPVVIGGPHVTFLPEEALMKGADFVVRGEGETNFLDLVRAILEKKTSIINQIPGISFKVGEEFHHNPLIPDYPPITDLPWPNLRLIQNWEKMPILPILTSRGCPYNCTFCSVTKMFGRRYRTRLIDDIIAELEFWLGQKKWRSVFFYDDNFACQPERTKQLLREIINRKLKIHWTAQVRVDVAKDEELLQMMKASGGYVLYIGLESINPRSLEKYRKNQTVEEIARAIDLIHKYGLQVHGMFVLGSDEDDRQTIDETVKFARKMKIDTVQFMVLTPLPGTETFFELASQGRLLEKDWSKYSGHHVVFRPRLLSAYELQKEAAIRAMRRFYSFWQCWKFGFQFRWQRLAIYTYARHAISQWLSENRDFLKKLRFLSPAPYNSSF
ncbi:MAG: B12-binding domain-containing radical SAM protein [Candidatus Aminicenantes bacterium]|nr:B12-binding domain-containing radical SAM protein [Candidatus Aminicenantes bacterium]